MGYYSLGYITTTPTNEAIFKKRPCTIGLYVNFKSVKKEDI